MTTQTKAADPVLPPLPEWMSNYTIPADDFAGVKVVMLADRMRDYARAAVLADREAQQQDKLDAARWRYIRRKLCLIGNGDGTCSMQAINLPAAIQGWPEPEQVAEFCDAAIDAALREEGKQ